MYVNYDKLIQDCDERLARIQAELDAYAAGPRKGAHFARVAQ